MRHKCIPRDKLQVLFTDTILIRDIPHKAVPGRALCIRIIVVIHDDRAIVVAVGITKNACFQFKSTVLESKQRPLVKGDITDSTELDQVTDVFCARGCCKVAPGFFCIFSYDSFRDALPYTPYPLIKASAFYVDDIALRQQVVSHFTLTRRRLYDFTQSLQLSGIKLTAIL